MPDVTIIGAGPAGSTAAILLARAGWAVTLVEQSRFPRDKVCGECLSAIGMDVLFRLDIADAVRAAGAVRLDGAEVHTSGGRSRRLSLPRPMWGLSRSVLDALMLDGAREQGVRVLQPARCERIGRPLLIRDLVSNIVEPIHATHVIVADGKGALAAPAPPPTGDFGIKAHFIDVDGPRDAIELFGVRGSYGGLAAIEGNRWNAAFSVPAARLKAHRGNVEALFGEIVRENAALARRLGVATRVGDWLAAPLPRFAVRPRWTANVIPVGNAAAALEPIGGEGIGLAMRSAELAAEALIRGDVDVTPLRKRFQTLWRTRRASCRVAAIAASSPTFSRAIVSTPLPRAAQRVALRLMGKTTRSQPSAGAPLGTHLP